LTVVGRLFLGKCCNAASEITVPCVRRYLRFSLSYRDLEEMLTERNLSVDHSTLSHATSTVLPGLLAANLHRTSHGD
jgi:transposase-like protein